MDLQLVATDIEQAMTNEFVWPGFCPELQPMWVVLPSVKKSAEATLSRLRITTGLPLAAAATDSPPSPSTFTPLTSQFSGVLSSELS